MKVLETLKELREIQQNKSETLGFIPTMGALHDGHGSLIKESVKSDDLTMVSIFVNPTQFNVASDLETYPVTTKKDLQFCEKLGVDYVYMPDVTEVYFDEETIKIDETSVSSKFEGEFRPGHFNGVMIVVLKLLQSVLPDRAYFGKKDYQQYLLIKQMARNFFVQTEIVGVDIYRDEFGLPYSSRNLKFNKEDLKKARAVSRAFLQTNSLKEFTSAVDVDLDYYGELEGRILLAHNIGDVRVLDNKVVSK